MTASNLLYRSMPKADYKPVVAGNWGLSSLKILEIVGKEGLEGTVMGQALDLSDPKAAAFDAKMQKEFGDKYRWPVVAALGYDGMKLLLKAIDAAGSDPTKISRCARRHQRFRRGVRHAGEAVRTQGPRVPRSRERIPGRLARRPRGAPQAVISP